MGLKTYLNDSLLLEGGKALKQTTGIKQKHVAALHAELIPKIAQAVGVPVNLVAPIGSAGRKRHPEELSGDIDIAIQTSDINSVLSAIQRLGNGTSYRAMPGINVYSFAAPHPEGLVQVDLMPVANLKLAQWAFYSADADLSKGLKGSHRNELLFALAKWVAMIHRPHADVTDAERERYQLDLNSGLFKVLQTRMGKKGPVKSFTTTRKELVTSDPDEICRILFGFDVPSASMLSFEDAWKAMTSERFGYKTARSEVMASTAAGLSRKELTLPAQLLAVVAAPRNTTSS